MPDADQPWFGRAFGRDGIRVGWAVPGAGPAEVALGPVDRRRVPLLGGRRRQAFLTGRALLGRLVAEQLGPGGVDTSPCPRCGADHGPVAVRGTNGAASVAYADGLVVAAVGRMASLGLDVERDRPDPVRDGDLARLLRVAPGHALRRWVEIEAVLKANGAGLRIDPARVEVTGERAKVADDPRRYRLGSIDGPAGYLVSLAWVRSPAI